MFLMKMSEISWRRRDSDKTSSALSRVRPLWSSLALTDKSPHVTASGAFTSNCIQDTAASVQNLLLVAHELGLGACWVGAFKEEKVREILNLPDNLIPVAIVPVGYPVLTPKAPERVSRQGAVEMIA